MSLPQLVAGSCCHVLSGGMACLSPTVLGHQATFPGTLWLKLPPQNPGVAFDLTCTNPGGGYSSELSLSGHHSQWDWLPSSCSLEVFRGLVGPAPAPSCPPQGSHLVQAQSRLGKAKGYVALGGQVW